MSLAPLDSESISMTKCSRSVDYQIFKCSAPPHGHTSIINMGKALFRGPFSVVAACFLKQGLFVRVVSVSSALRRDIQAVVHQQPIDQPDQFSGS